LGAVSTGHAQAENDRIALLQEQIQAMSRVVDATKDPGEKSRLQTKLQRMQQEMGILQERQAIGLQERALEQTREVNAADVLRDKLRTIGRTEEEAEASVREIAVRRQKASEEEAAMAAQLANLRAGNQPNQARESELEEQIFTKSEEVRGLALQQEAAEAEVDLVRDADRLSKQLKADDEAGARPSLRVLFESYTELRAQQNNESAVRALLAELGQSLKVNQNELDLLRQKLGKSDEEMALLEKQTSFFHRDAEVEKFLASERSEKQQLLDRLPSAVVQVDAIKQAQQAVASRQELNALGEKVRQDQFATRKVAYLQRLRWPAATLGVMLGLQLISGYAILPMFYKNEGLFLARRLGRYLFLLGVAVVAAAFFFDDLSMVAATLGIVSAALVISLQDVCTSICGWFVIIGGGKFHIGDRLEIDGIRGDILDIQLLRTILVEIGGWLGTDQPTGRVILVPNNAIFKTKIFNYSHGHPYIWGKLDVTITFDTSLSQAQTLLQRVLAEETRETMAEARQAAAIMRRRYGVDDAVYEPKIYTAIADSGIVLSLFYVAHYRNFSAMRARLSQRVLVELDAHRDIHLAYPTLSILRGGEPSRAPEGRP
jgi:small-conductance mechanosensitive channel